MRRKPAESVEMFEAGDFVDFAHRFDTLFRVEHQRVFVAYFVDTGIFETPDVVVIVEIGKLARMHRALGVREKNAAVSTRTHLEVALADFLNVGGPGSPA